MISTSCQVLRVFLGSVLSDSVSLSLGADGKPDSKQPIEEEIQKVIDSKNSRLIRVEGLLEGSLPVVPEAFFNQMRDFLDKARKKKGEEKTAPRSKKRVSVEDLGHQMEEKHQAAGAKPLAEMKFVPPAKKRAKQIEPIAAKPVKSEKAEKPVKSEKPSAAVKVVKPAKSKPAPVVVVDEEEKTEPLPESGTDEYTHPTDRAIVDQLCRVVPLMTEFFAPERLAKMWATPEAREKQLLNIFQRVQFVNGVPAFPGADLVPMLLSIFTEPAKEILVAAAEETRKKNTEAQRSMSSSTTKGIPSADFWSLN